VCVCVCMCVFVRERERERDRDRQTDRLTDTQTLLLTDTQTGRQALTHGQTYRQSGGPSGGLRTEARCVRHDYLDYRTERRRVGVRARARETMHTSAKPCPPAPKGDGVFGTDALMTAPKGYSLITTSVIADHYVSDR
jgi:hypothetical protein